MLWHVLCMYAFIECPRLGRSQPKIREYAQYVASKREVTPAEIPATRVAALAKVVFVISIGEAAEFNM